MGLEILVPLKKQQEFSWHGLSTAAKTHIPSGGYPGRRITGFFLQLFQQFIRLEKLWDNSVVGA